MKKTLSTNRDSFLPGLLFTAPTETNPFTNLQNESRLEKPAEPIGLSPVWAFAGPNNFSCKNWPDVTVTGPGLVPPKLLPVSARAQPYFSHHPFSLSLLAFHWWTRFSPFVPLAATLIEDPSITGVKRKVVHTPLITYSKRGKSPTVIENLSIAF